MPQFTIEATVSTDDSIPEEYSVTQLDDTRYVVETTVGAFDEEDAREAAKQGALLSGAVYTVERFRRVEEVF